MFQMLCKCEEIDSLQSTKDCMSETIKVLKQELMKSDDQQTAGSAEET